MDTDDVDTVYAEFDTAGIFGNPFVPAYIRDDPNSYVDSQARGGTAAD
jgi:hypothetical protein